MLESLEWDEEEGQTQETVLPSPLRAPRRSRPSAAGLRVILGSSPGAGAEAEAEAEPNTERDVAPATVSSPPAPGSQLFRPAPPPVIDVIEAEEMTIPAERELDPDGITLHALREMSVGAWQPDEQDLAETITQLRDSSAPPTYDSEAPPSAIRSVLPPPMSAPLPLVAADVRAPNVTQSSYPSAPPQASTQSSYPPAPAMLQAQPTLSHSLDATLLAHEVVRLRRGMLVALVVASAALTLSLILALVMLWQLEGPAEPAQPQHTPARHVGPQLL